MNPLLLLFMTYRLYRVTIFFIIVIVTVSVSIQVLSINAFHVSRRYCCYCSSFFVRVCVCVPVYLLLPPRWLLLLLLLLFPFILYVSVLCHSFRYLISIIIYSNHSIFMINIIASILLYLELG